MEKSTRAWNTRQEYSENYLADVYIKKGIFQGDSLSLLLFITSLICLSGILRNAVQGYRFKQLPATEYGLP